MIKLRNSLSLAQEETSSVLSSTGFGIAKCIDINNFYGHLPVKERIYCKIDLTHATAFKQAHKPVVAELLSFC